MIYFFIAIVFVLFIYLYDIGNFSKGKNYALFICWMLFSVTAGLSYRVGIDAIRYAEDFVHQPTVFQLADFDFSNAIEDPLWIIFSALFRTFTTDFTVLHLVHAMIVNGAIVYFVQRIGFKPFTTLLIYFLTFFLFFNFETLRESLSVAVFLFAYQALTEKQWIRYYIIAFTCYFIHSSASFTFFIPLFLLITRIKSWLPLIIIAGTFIILGRYVNEIVLNILPTLSLSERMVYKLGVYFGRDEIGISTGFLLKNVVLPMSLLLADKFFLKKSSKFTPYTKIFLVLGAISMIIPVVDRLLNYLVVFYIIHVAETCVQLARLFELRVVKFIVLNLLIICFTFAPLSWLFTVDDRISEYNYNRYFPYSFFLFGEKIEVREKFFTGGS